MKKLLLGLLFVWAFVIEAQAPTLARAGVTVMPKPSPESAGKLVFEGNGCSICHGFQGKGDGPLAGNLDPKPRDFTDFEQMSRISDMSMYHAIRNGIPDTAMPSWELTDDQIFDAISYIKRFLADSQTTINICLNEQRTIDLRNLDFDQTYKINIDRKEFFKFKLKGKKVFVTPKFTNVLRYFKKTGMKLIRNHVTITQPGQTRFRALIAVRISDCLK